MSSLQNSHFWKNRAVLVTGATGFIGSHLVKSLLKEGAKVITLSKNKRLPSYNLHKIGSVINFNKLNKLIKNQHIDTIFHLAAQPIVEVGKSSPIKTFEVNIKGTWNILESARINSVRKIIIASTTHVYGDNPNVPYKEEYYPQPSRPYETSKACADLLAQVYADTYNLPVEIPRFVNIYGPGDLNFSRLIPKVVRDILKGNNPKIWDVGTIRDFLFIDDAVRAYLMLAEKELPKTKRGRVLNFGTGKPINIVDLVEKIIKIINNHSMKIAMEKIPENRSAEIRKQYVSIEKAKRELRWYPRTSLEEGLKKTIKWYKENEKLFI